tara:strand:+ start:16 stop:264 length:249 start_codon:yes stop_codon:yes gene_type:complete
MLSQKYYKAIAKVFKNGYKESYINTYEKYQGFDGNIIGCHIAEMQWELIEFLKKDNPKFDEDTFLKAMEVDLPKLKIELDKE